MRQPGSRGLRPVASWKHYHLFQSSTWCLWSLQANILPYRLVYPWKGARGFAGPITCLRHAFCYIRSRVALNLPAIVSWIVKQYVVIVNLFNTHTHVCVFIFIYYTHICVRMIFIVMNVISRTQKTISLTDDSQIFPTQHFSYEIVS